MKYPVNTPCYSVDELHLEKRSQSTYMFVAVHPDNPEDGILLDNGKPCIMSFERLYPICNRILDDAARFAKAFRDIPRDEIFQHLIKDNPYLIYCLDPENSDITIYNEEDRL